MKRAVVLLMLMLASDVAYGTRRIVDIPALDDGGLIALVGAVGGIVARRRKK